MTMDHEKENTFSGKLDIVKLDRSDDENSSSDAILPPAPGPETLPKENINDARYDPRLYQLKSERLEKTLKECEEEILLLVELLKNKKPEKEDNSNEPGK